MNNRNLATNILNLYFQILKMNIKVKFIEDGVVYSCSVHRIKTVNRLYIGSRVDCRYKDGRWYQADIIDILDGKR